MDLVKSFQNALGFGNKATAQGEKKDPPKPPVEHKIPEPEIYESPRFDVEDPKAYEYLHENGYVVFKTVAAEEQLVKARDLLWSFIESTPYGAKRGDPTTWRSNWIGNPALGIVSGYAVGQSALQWHIRTLPSVRKAFATVWGSENLLVSFDGIGIFRPWSFDKKWKTATGWYHVDQSPLTKPGFECVQGLVALYDGDETTGGLVVVPGSHKHFTTIDTVRKTDFVNVPATQDIWLKLNRPRMVKCKAGDLILWDSRTIHCNMPAPVEKVKPEDESWELLRAVCYVCMTPITKADPKELDSLLACRKEAFQAGVTTTHWPHIFTPSSMEGWADGVEPVQLTPQIEALILGK
eukprot:Colp12_sorted_trinity150504_noHs@12447